MSVSGEVRFIGIVDKAGDQESKVRIFPEFCAGLKGIEHFSHLIILYWLHLRDTPKDRRTLLVFPKRYMVNVETGVYACRSPSRPNPIGLSVVELLKVENCILTLKNLDALERSPIIDVKPYIPRNDSFPSARSADWTER
jgi:tRNA-Thr(GGU) m(6)t(6)A37 methyltransferase TsaA